MKAAVQVIEHLTDGTFGEGRLSVGVLEDGSAVVLRFDRFVPTPPVGGVADNAEIVLIEGETSFSPAKYLVSKWPGVLPDKPPLYAYQAIWPWRVSVAQCIASYKHIAKVPLSQIGNATGDYARSIARAVLWNAEKRAKCLEDYGETVLQRLAALAHVIGRVDPEVVVGEAKAIYEAARASVAKQKLAAQVSNSPSMDEATEQLAVHPEMFAEIEHAVTQDELAAVEAFESFGMGDTGKKTGKKKSGSAAGPSGGKGPDGGEEYEKRGANTNSDQADVDFSAASRVQSVATSGIADAVLRLVGNDGARPSPVATDEIGVVSIDDSAIEAALAFDELDGQVAQDGDDDAKALSKDTKANSAQTKVKLSPAPKPGRRRGYSPRPR